MKGRAVTVRKGDLVGPIELAALFDVTRGWIDNLRWRGEMLEPFDVISGRPIWIRSEVEAWWVERQAKIKGKPAAKPAAKGKK